jgi:hypothetical protein
MTATNDLGEVTNTRTEWFSRETDYDGNTHNIGSGDEQQARNIVESTREQIANLNEPWRRHLGVKHVDLVRRTITEYASGHKLIGPWEVTE